MRIIGFEDRDTALCNAMSRVGTKNPIMVIYREGSEWFSTTYEEFHRSNNANSKSVRFVLPHYEVTKLA